MLSARGNPALGGLHFVLPSSDAEVSAPLRSGWRQSRRPKPDAPSESELGGNSWSPSAARPARQHCSVCVHTNSAFVWHTMLKELLYMSYKIEWYWGRLSMETRVSALVPSRLAAVSGRVFGSSLSASFAGQSERPSFVWGSHRRLRDWSGKVPYCISTSGGIP